MLSDNLEKTIKRSISYANDRQHEYVTLEHLLLALIDDEDANEVLLSCNVDIEELRAVLNDFIANELTSEPLLRHIQREYGLDDVVFPISFKNLFEKFC